MFADEHRPENTLMIMCGDERLSVHIGDNNNARPTMRDQLSASGSHQGLSNRNIAVIFKAS